MLGCKGAKSAIEIFKKSRSTTIFEVKVQQIEVRSFPLHSIRTNAGFIVCSFHVQELNKEYDVNIPLVFMNSPSTEEETEMLIQRQKGKRVEIYTFTQSMYPLMVSTID